MNRAKRPRNRSGLLLGAAVVVTGVCAAALGQSCPPASTPAKYHPRPIAWLGDLDSTEDCWYASSISPSPPGQNPFTPGDGLGVISMNASGEIVGTYMTLVENAKVPRPFVWLPQSNYGLDAGFHDILSALHPTGSPSVIGYAWDISDGGMVVGGKGGHPDTSEGCRAMAWDLDSMTESQLDPSPTTLSWSMAIAIEPSPDPNETIEIVGTGALDCAVWRRALRFRIGQGPSLLSTTDPPGVEGDTDHVQSLRKWACDVTNGGLAPVGSYDTPAPLPASTCTLPPLGTAACTTPMLAGAAFDGNPPTFFRRVDDNDPNILNAEPTGVRSIALIEDSDPPSSVVAGYVNDPAGFCPRKAALWQYESDPLNAEILPEVLGFTRSMAQRWRDVACGTEVVLGWTAETTGEEVLGLVWDRCAEGGGVCATLMNDLLAGHGANDGAMQLYEVLDTGEILGLAVHFDLGETEVPAGIYLALFSLAGDFDHDWAVDAADLAILLGAWGVKNSMEFDLDGSGKVDAGDMAILLGLWGTGELELPCSGGFCPPGTSPPGDSMMAGEPLQLPLAAFGFSSVEDFVAWGLAADAESLDSVCTAMAWVIQSGSGGEQ